MDGEGRKLSVVRSLCKLLLVLFAVAGGCMREEYVSFKPVYVIDEEYVISEDPVSAEFRQNIKSVLGFFDIPYKVADNGMILVPKRVWSDTDTMWNYTTKANDPQWLRQTAEEAGGLVIENIQVFGRPAPIAPWQRVQEKGVLYFMNFCTIRVVSTLRIPKGGGVDDLNETIFVEKEGERRVLVDKRPLVDMDKPPDPKTLLNYTDEESAETILHLEFPCFEDRPDWIKPGATVTLTVIVSSGGRTAGKSFSFIYDELSH